MPIARLASIRGLGARAAVIGLEFFGRRRTVLSSVSTTAVHHEVCKVSDVISRSQSPLAGRLVAGAS